MEEKRRLRLRFGDEVDDAVLMELARGASAEAATRGSIPLDEFRSEGSSPFDVETVKPSVYDLRKLFRRTGRNVPPEVESTMMGPSLLLLVCHGVTPFHKAGADRQSVWGLGYESRLDDGVQAESVGYCPLSRELDVGSVEQSISLGIGLGGEFSAPTEALGALSEIPGVVLNTAELRASTHQHLALSLKLKLALRSIQAGPVGAGGVRWNLYQQDQALDQHVPLFQTLLVPRDTPSLTFKVKTWVRTRSLFGLRSREWVSDWTSYPVTLSRS
jgi:hypothetical protein